MSGLLFSLLIVGCKDDIDSEITELDFDRLLSVTDVVASVNEQTVSVNFTENANADYYIIEFYNDSIEDFNSDDVNASITSFEDSVTVTIDDIPYSSTFISQEMYSVRIKACSDSEESSLWSGSTFETSAEDIFETLSSDNITKSTVTLNWPADSDVDYFIISPDLSDGTDSIRITDDQKAAGEATITGFDYETEYQVTMYQDGNEKRRGRVTFTTLPDGITIDIETYGTDIASIISENPYQNTFFLETGTYSSESAIDVDRDIKIVPNSSTDEVVINAQFTFSSTDAVALTLEDVELNGAGTYSLDDLLAFDGATALGSISFTGCNIHDYSDDFFYFGSRDFAMSSLSIDDCIISNFGCSHAFVDVRDGVIEQLNFTNSTFANLGSSGYFMRCDGEEKSSNIYDNGTYYPTITMTNCTFYNNMASLTKSYFYIRWDNAATTYNFTNNIFAAASALACDLYDDSFNYSVATMTGNYLFNASTLLGSEGSSGTELSTDPFSDAKNSDFTVTDATLISAGVGDPRWITE